MYQRRGSHSSSAIIFGLARNCHRFLSSVCVLVTTLTELFRLLSVYYFPILISQHQPSEDYSNYTLYIKKYFVPRRKQNVPPLVGQVAVYCANHTEHINTPDGQNAVLYPSILVLGSPSLLYNGYQLVSGGSGRRVAFITNLFLLPSL